MVTSFHSPLPRKSGSWVEHLKSEARILVIFPREIWSTPANLNLQGKLKKIRELKTKACKRGKNGVYCFYFIPMVYIFVNAKIKWLLQNLLNGSDCSTLFVLIYHVLEDVACRSSSY